MQWAVLGIAIFCHFLIYVVVQGTMAHLKWREMAAKGDLDIIRRLIDGQMEVWQEMRMPKGEDPQMGGGTETAELVSIGPDYARVSCAAEGQYTLVDGQRREALSPLEEGMKLTMKLADRFLYDTPNLRLDRVQIDIYTTFRDEGGGAQQRCILSTIVRPSQAIALDWDASAHEIVDQLGGRYRLAPWETALPVEPLAGGEGGG